MFTEKFCSKSRKFFIRLAQLRIKDPGILERVTSKFSTGSIDFQHPYSIAFLSFFLSSLFIFQKLINDFLKLLCLFLFIYFFLCWKQINTRIYVHVYTTHISKIQLYTLTKRHMRTVVQNMRRGGDDIWLVWNSRPMLRDANVKSYVGWHKLFFKLVGYVYVRTKRRGFLWEKSLMKTLKDFRS